MKIAIIGKMRSGKDTFAQHLINELELTEYKFGDGIREVIEKYFPEEIKKGKPRELLQGIGQYFRTFDNNVWIKFLEVQVGGKDNIIITDVRQENEVEWLRQNGFIIVKVIAPESERIKRILESGDNVDTTQLDNILNHETELYADEVQADFVINNNSTLEALVTKAKLFIDLLSNTHALQDLRNRWGADGL